MECGMKKELKKGRREERKEGRKEGKGVYSKARPTLPTQQAIANQERLPSGASREVRAPRRAQGARRLFLPESKRTTEHLEAEYIYSFVEL